MAFTKDKNQNEVPRGFCRYRFDERYRGKRYRKKVVCKVSEVKDLYRKWQKEFIDIAEMGDFRLFEIFEEYLEHVRNTKSRSACVNEERYIRMFREYFSDMPLRSFRRYHVEDFISWRKRAPQQKGVREVADSTVNRTLASLSCFFTYCITREYYTRSNPCFKAKLKVSNEREIRMSSEEIEELLDNSREWNDQMYTSVILALLAGLRAGEILSLKWADVDFQESLIYLSASNTKSRRRRVVCMPDSLVDHMQIIKRENPFQEMVIRGWKYTTLRSKWDRMIRTLSFNPFSNGLSLRFHDLRHVYAQSLRDAGVPMSDIQTLLGHSSVRVTEERYAMFGGRDAKQKVNLIQKIIPIKSSRTG